jgi:hypothetical protein
MPELHGTITNVQSHVKTRKSDGKNFTLFEILMDGGTKYSTTDKAIAERAYNLVGKFVNMNFTEKHNGAYTNLYVNNIVAIPIAHNEKEILEVLNDQNSSYTPPSSAIQTPQPSLPQPATNDSREKTIWRQTATKVAAILSTDYEKFWTYVDELIAFYETGKKPSLDETRFVPKGAGQVEIPQSTHDDDIPF